MNKTNVVPFDLGGYPIAALDQTQMRFLRAIADSKDVAVVDVLDEAIALFAASHLAALEAKEKIIRFPLKR
jgi:hypothetical protein